MIIYYDGVCKLCTGFVSMVIRFSRPGTFRFQSLQQSTLKQNNSSYDSVVLEIHPGNYLFKSAAVSKILSNMYMPFRWLNTIISLFPEGLRNKIYDWIARSRYRWFGKHASCQIID
ncbi:MAG: DUF393 domain-containing protein [Chitinophagia bacterium]|nr:DUF393 domain-containing protein [Chitinophagia bacterium]